MFSSPSSLRIAEIAPVWLPVPPPGYGGIERVVAVLCDELVARGHDVTLFAVGGSQTRAKLVTTVEFRHIRMIRGGADRAVHALGAFRGPASLMSSRSHQARTGLAAVLSGGPPVVHTLHGPWTEQVRRYVDSVRDRVSLVAISHAQAAGNQAWVCRVYNGIDVAAHPYRRTKDDFLLFVGGSTRRRPGGGGRGRAPSRPAVDHGDQTAERAESAYWDEVIARC
jgi:glycosyltransferase involved in cell wall biosynthesis